MVAITRAAAARQQQTSNAEPTRTPGAVRKKNSKKKKTIIDQDNSSATTSSSLESFTITSTSGMFKQSLFKSSNANTYLIEESTTTTISSSTAKSYHQNTNDVIAIDCVSGINDTLGIDDSDQCVNLLLIKFNQTNDNEESKSSDLDDNKELDILRRWPIIIGEIEWCKTNRGNERLCMSGYTYDFMSESLKKNIRYFRCSKKDRGCHAVVHVLMESNMYKGSNNVEHNHSPNHHHVKRLLVLEKVKERVMTEPTSVTRIIEDEYVKNHLNDGDRQHFLLPSAQASKFYKIRAKLTPPNPRSLDFEVPELYAATHSGEEFLIYDSTHQKLGGRLMIFSTETLIKMLCSCEVILIDGTFKTRPLMFSQVYVIMGKHLAEAIPMVWCLAPKKTQEVYEKIFKVLQKKSADYGLKFEPKVVYMDFEVGTIKALEKIFPDVIIHGCWYHFTQCIFRNIQKIGLTSVYEKNEEIKTWLKSFMALPLIKHHAVEAAIQLLIQNVPSSDKLLIDFYEYFQQQWVTRVPIKYWNLGPIHLRCNNNVEGYNNRLQYRFGVHPQLWSFIHFLKGEESLVMMRAAQIRSGNYSHKAMPFSVGNQRLKQKTKQLKNLARLFELGTINLKKYIKSLSSFVGASATKKKQNDHIHTDGSQNNVINDNDI